MTVMAKHKYVGKTVAEILQGKRGSLKDAKLDEKSPSWDDILNLTWEELVARAKKRELGFKTFKKLLSKGEYNR